MPIVDQYMYLGVEISQDCSWDTHLSLEIEMGKVIKHTHVGEMGAILTDSHLDTIFIYYLYMDSVMPNL